MGENAAMEDSDDLLIMEPLRSYGSLLHMSDMQTVLVAAAGSICRGRYLFPMGYISYTAWSAGAEVEYEGGMVIST